MKLTVSNDEELKNTITKANSISEPPPYVLYGGIGGAIIIVIIVEEGLNLSDSLSEVGMRVPCNNCNHCNISHYIG